MIHTLKQFHTIENTEELIKSPRRGDLGGLKTYTAPSIELILLDNEISLALESTPPVGPNEGNNTLAPEFYNNDPWKTNLT